jgi:pentose-5-phosphate-3-epimerase
MQLAPKEFNDIYSELKAVEKALAAQERRRHSRIEIDGSVGVTDLASNHKYGARTKDISFSGISIIQSKAPPAGSRIVVSLPQRHRASFDVHCTVLYVRAMAEHLYCVGCTFTATVD